MKYTSSVTIDPDQWDGNDFFRCTNHGSTIFITERVRDMLLAEKLTNWECFDMEQFAARLRGERPAPRWHGPTTPLR